MFTSLLNTGAEMKYSTDILCTKIGIKKDESVKSEKVSRKIVDKIQKVQDIINETSASCQLISVGRMYYFHCLFTCAFS